MPVYYSSSTCSNPLAATRTSRFAVHPAATCELAAGHNDTGRHNLNFPTYPHPGCHPFTLCLACPPPAARVASAPSNFTASSLTCAIPPHPAGPSHRREVQNHQNRPDYPNVVAPSFPSHPGSGGAAGMAFSALDPYTPPNVPHGLPHVVRFDTLSSIERLGSRLALLRDGISPDALPALPTAWTDAAAAHPRSRHTPYPAVFLLLPTPARDAVSSPPFQPVPYRTARTNSTPTPSGAASGGTAVCGPPPAGPWRRRR